MIVVGVSPFSFRIGLGQVGPLLGLAVILRTGAVIDVRFGVQPNHSRTASRSCGGSDVGVVGGCRLRRRRSRCCGRSRRYRCRCSGSGWSRRSGGSGFGRRRRSCRRSRGRGEPLLDPLVAAAGSALRGSSRIGSVFAETGCACRSGRLGVSGADGEKRGGQNKERGRQTLHRNSFSTFKIETGPRVTKIARGNRTPGSGACHGEVGLPDLVPIWERDRLQAPGVSKRAHNGIPFVTCSHALPITADMPLNMGGPG